MAAAKAEAAHNRRHYRAAMLELSEIKKDLQSKEDLIKALRTEAQKLQYVDMSDKILMFSKNTDFILLFIYLFVSFFNCFSSSGLRKTSTLRMFPGSRRSLLRLMVTSRSSRNNSMRN